MAAPTKKIADILTWLNQANWRQGQPPQLLQFNPQAASFPHVSGGGQIPSGATMNMPPPSYPQLTTGAMGQPPQLLQYNPQQTSFPYVSGGGTIPSGATMNMPSPSYPQLPAGAKGATAKAGSNLSWLKKPITIGKAAGAAKGLSKLAFNPYTAAALASPMVYSMFQKPIQKMWGLTDWQAYKDAGGTLSEPAWKKAGRPAPTGQVTEYAKGAEARAAKREPTEEDTTTKMLRELATQAAERAGRVGAVPTGALPKGYKWEWNPTAGEWYPALQGEQTTREKPPTQYPSEVPAGYIYNPVTGELVKDPSYVPPKPTPTRYDPYGKDPYGGGQGQWNPYTGQWEAPQGYISPQMQWEATQQKEQQQGLQEQMIAWQREQQQGQLAAQKEQQLASLRGNPASWLEYASLAGQTPVIQPWMLPLQPQDYGWQAGQALQGWGAPTVAGEPPSAGLPELTQPSAQYMSRIAPSARAQYGGYEQARSGATPEDIQWKLWSNAPPGGTYSGLRRLR